MNDTYNPDVLSCLANLSNDEVFTPPAVVNQMLDLLPPELFRDSSTTFLDIGCKSGVFLREIAKRLIAGLAEEIPDLQTRVDHILHRQVFGIATTELTSLVARRTLYCSKYPNCRYSASRFETVEGNIRFRNIPHEFVNGRCKWCGASEDQFGAAKRKGLETHAYEFIHTAHPEEIFNMKFDVIVGNPPYQLSTAGSVESQATPIYDEFVSQAIKLSPRFLTMIIPSRWMYGGFGLDDFRLSMLSDQRLEVLHDYMNAEDCFPGVQIAGGVCYFLWNRARRGTCKVYTHRDDGKVSSAKRFLLEEGLSTFVRFNEAISILEKVRGLHEHSFSEIVSQRDPFGLNYFEDGHEKMFKLIRKTPSKDDCKIYSFGWQREGISYTDRKYVSTNKDAMDMYKIFISKANGAASSKIPYSVLSQPFVASPGSICNMTYLLVGPFEQSFVASNANGYIKTKFFRFLVSLLKNTQNAYKKVYQFVPMQDFSKPWTDAELYAKYKLTDDEIAFIESMIKPME